MTIADQLERGRRSFADREWASAYAALTEAGVGQEVGADDLERLATAAVLLGRDAEGCDVFGRAHSAYLLAGDPERAAKCAFWTGMIMSARGTAAPSSGWLARAVRVAESSPPESVVHGYLRIPAARQALVEGDLSAALDGFSAALSVGERAHDGDLVVLAQLGLGQAYLARGEADRGRAHLDEVMVAVTAGEVAEIPSGIAYCAVIGLCRLTLDVRRAREWTDALALWCDRQPDLVQFRGECLVHRSEVMLERGDWADALLEADRAASGVVLPPGPALGSALYQKGEVHRLRGELDAAEAAYRDANLHGFLPQPGLLLLSLTRGRVDAAAGAVRLLLQESPDPAFRRLLLPAAVDVLIAANDLGAARAAADELDALAQDQGECLHALAARARGSVLLAAGDPLAALDLLRRAWLLWQALDVPYEAAQTRVLLGRACRALGDEDGAQLELDAARWVFARLGARPDLTGLGDAARGSHGAGGPSAVGVTAVDSSGRAMTEGGLTVREVEVLRLVATGRTNRAIAGDLFLSEKTVARHLSNIFTKLDLPSRAAATAYAYEHDLVPGRPEVGRTTHGSSP